MSVNNITLRTWYYQQCERRTTRPTINTSPVATITSNIQNVISAPGGCEIYKTANSCYLHESDTTE